MKLEWSTIDTPTGPLTLVVGPDGLVAGGFKAHASELQLPKPLRDAELVERGSLGEATKTAERYFAGDLTAWDTLPVMQIGGPFISEAWRALRAIPAGTTVTYTELAALAGRPDAIRAAAQACATNMIAPIVPCHRVIRTDGSLGGYYYGLPVKRWLLDHEANYAAENRQRSLRKIRD